MTDGRVPILMYHAVSTSPNDATRELSVAPEAFAEQMALIADLGLTPVRTADLAARWRSGRPLPERRPPCSRRPPGPAAYNSRPSRLPTRGPPSPARPRPPADDRG